MNKPPVRAPGHDDGWRNPLLPRDVQHGHDDGWVNAGKPGSALERGIADSAAGRVQDRGDFTQHADVTDEQIDQLTEQHRDQMAREYNPAMEARADSLTRLTERVLEDQRRATQAQLNQAAQRRGR